MSVWLWVLIWAVLVLGALGVLAMIGLSLWRRLKLLLRELSAASDRFAEISAKLEVAAQRPEPEQPAVFSDPSALRQERFLAHRAGKPVARPVSGSAGQSGYRVR